MKCSCGWLVVSVMFLASSAGAQNAFSDSKPLDKGKAGVVATPLAPERSELLKQIAIFEEKARHDEATAPPSDLAKVYMRLGWMYSDLAMYPRAEDSFRRAIALLRDGVSSEQASALDDLAMLHVAMGDLNMGEKEGLQALRLRMKVGEPVAIGGSYAQLAALYMERRQYKKAVEYGQKATEAFGDSQENPEDRISVRYTVARALCASKQCAQAIPILQQATEQAKTAFGDDSVPVGLGFFELGIAYWRTGDKDAAAIWMDRGMVRMKKDLDWGHPLYIAALRQYSKFLREQGDVDSATAMERQVRQADAVVDVSTMTGRSGQSLR